MIVFLASRYAKSTENKCEWAFNIFTSWKTNRNERAIREPQLNISPIRTELVEMTTDEMCYAMIRFVLEVRKQNGEEYPSNTLYEMIIAIQLYLSIKGVDVKFLKDECFKPLSNTLDTRMKELAASGKRVPRRQAEIITIDEEEQMWKTGILGSSSPQQLLDTTLYMIGMHFALRAGQEHYQLRYPDCQISTMTHSDGRSFLRYTEDASKACQGGLKHRNLVPKTVDAFENLDNPDRCIVALFHKYVNLRPQSDADNALYLRALPKPRIDGDTEVWYSRKRIGINVLSKTVARLCDKAGVTGFKSNHSLRATAASRLYRSGMDEQQICETTGHRSVAVRNYKRTSDEQRADISNVLYNNTSTSKAKRSRSATSTVTSVTPGVLPAVASPDITQGAVPLNITVNVNLN